MFIIIVLITIMLAWRYSDWRNWERYQSTMLLFGLGNLLYNFVYHDNFLWKFNPDFFNHHIMEIVYSFTVFPLTALMLLSYLPEKLKGQLIRILKFVFIYITVEFVLLKIGKFEFNYGWNIWWSLAWDCIMFPLLIIHHKKPLIGFFFSILLIFIMNWIFPFKLN